MKGFLNELDRMSHPQARYIPLGLWLNVFKKILRDEECDLINIFSSSSLSFNEKVTHFRQLINKDNVERIFCCFTLTCPQSPSEELARIIEELELTDKPVEQFYLAALSGHHPLFEKSIRMLHVKRESVQALLKARDYVVFQDAVFSGSLPIIKHLIALAGVDAHAMLQSEGYIAFEHAAHSGDLAVVESLIDLAQTLEINPQLMLHAEDYITFQRGAESGNLPVIERLITLAGPQVPEMLKSWGYGAFQSAAGSGSLAVVERLIALAGMNAQLMIKGWDYDAFHSAASSGSLAVVKRLIALAEDNVQAMLVSRNYEAFRNAIESKCLAIIHHLLTFPIIFNYAELHHLEYSPYILSFVREKLSNLRERKRLYELHSPQGVFDIEDVNERCLCFYLMRHFIRLNERALDDELLFLLSIPAVKAQAHRGRGDNELLRLAQNTNNTYASAPLLMIPAVQQLAHQHDFYRREIPEGNYLERLAQDPESSMSALTTGERKRFERLLAQYESAMRAEGTEKIMTRLRQELISRYIATPAAIRLDNGKESILPATWNEFNTLELTNSERKRALIAYYQDKNHTAWRYLSKPNAWIHPRAGYVERDSTGTYSTFQQYSSLIGLLWLAAQDAGAIPTEDFTIASRLEHFIDELAHIGRAHNWDKARRLGVSEEEYDDLEGDRPSCHSGVKRRLFQSVLGHPLLQIIDWKRIEQHLRDFVREQFCFTIRRLSLDEKTALSKAYETHILNAGEDKPITDPLIKLNISEEAVEHFMMSIDKQYRGQLSEEPGFREKIRQQFILKGPDYAHALTFDGLVQFSTLLPVSIAFGKVGFFSGPSDTLSEDTATTQAQTYG